MERRREPFNSNPNTGSMAVRYEWEQPDERPCIVYREPFWEDEAERLRYERAVKMCPLSQYRHLDMFDYLAEVAKVARGLKPGPSEPQPRDEMLAEMRKAG